MNNIKMRILVLAALTASTSACSNGFKSTMNGGMGAADLGSQSTSTISTLRPNSSSVTATEDVKKLYEEILGRPADDAGLAAWVDAVVNKGVSLEDVRKSFAGSDEAKGLINALFKTNLKRNPVDSELNGMIEKLAASHTLAQVETLIKGLVSVNESNIQSIKSVYLDVLGRAADQAGLNFFVDQMANGLSLSDVRATVANSDEAKALISNMYMQILKRSPSAAELSAEVSKLATGQKLANLEARLASVANIAAGFESGVKSLFQQILLRNPDQAGLTFWVNFLQNGGSLSDVRKNIANSDEAKTIINGMYQQHLVRSASAAEIAGHVNTLSVLGVTMLTVENDILGAATRDSAIVFVKNLYRSALNRDAETAGLSAFVNRIRNNNTVATCIQTNRDFYYSAEFQNRNLAPSDFLESMYRGILGRPSDAAGKVFWLNRLVETPSYTQKVDYFAASDEAIARCKNVLGAR